MVVFNCRSEKLQSKLIDADVITLKDIVKICHNHKYMKYFRVKSDRLMDTIILLKTFANMKLTSDNQVISLNFLIDTGSKVNTINKRDLYNFIKNPKIFEFSRLSYGYNNSKIESHGAVERCNRTIRENFSNCNEKIDTVLASIRLSPTCKNQLLLYKHYLKTPVLTQIYYFVCYKRYHQNNDVAENICMIICDTCHVNTKEKMRLVSRNDAKRGITSGRPRKLNENHINFVVERVNESPRVSSIQLATEFT
ncbi:hypothetical protein A3Q56_01951 [Intoshia linei]|uniref:Uncharacterized protein n=1 Tax=Intoshia linei TaxID=1819745 RepID=A0A177B7R0_9BILA|nr:hypothetical protein A3Q56_01951 [Intoshia linei]